MLINRNQRFVTTEKFLDNIFMTFFNNICRVLSLTCPGVWRRKIRTCRNYYALYPLLVMRNLFSINLLDDRILSFFLSHILLLCVYFHSIILLKHNNNIYPKYHFNAFKHSSAKNLSLYLFRH